MENYITTAFRIISFAPGPFWLMLLICPKNRWAMMAFDVFLILLSLHFTILLLPDVVELFPVIASPTFQNISAFICTPKGILGSWNHMILADLWMGRWMMHDGMKLEIPRWVLSLILFVILFFGSMGVFVYWLVRLILRRQWRLSAP